MSHIYHISAQLFEPCYCMAIKFNACGMHQLHFSSCN